MENPVTCLRAQWKPPSHTYEHDGRLWTMVFNLGVPLGLYIFERRRTDDVEAN